MDDITLHAATPAAVVMVAFWAISVWLEEIRDEDDWWSDLRKKVKRWVKRGRVRAIVPVGMKP